MTRESPVTFSRATAGAAAIALLMAGAGATYLLMRGSPVAHPTAGKPAGDIGGRPPAPAALSTGASPTGAGSTSTPDVVVPLTPDAVKRAGIVTAPVSTGTSAAELRLPGVVQPNAYRQVLVTPLVSGRVTRVSAELGERVRRGQAMAHIYSPELAEVQTRYVSARAALDAHDRELQRTQKLVEIGAASRQELERIHAEHAAQTAAVRSARSQLELLGMPPSTLDGDRGAQPWSATIAVPAPLDGVVTERGANVGLNVTPASTLFTVVDLSTVWIVADVYERDLAGVRVGSAATVTTTAYPDLAVKGRVSYIDPRVNAETRTAQVRVEVPNPRGDLRLGMFADVVVTGAGSAVPMMPRSAVQNVGDRTVVYLVDPEDSGRFVEREVRLGQPDGNQVQVASGVQPGDLVVAEGSFFVKAERERLGLEAPVDRPAARASGASAAVSNGGANPRVQTARITVNAQGFEPARVTLTAGTRARLTFVRTTDSTCANEVVFPSLNITRALPLNQAVDIEFTPPESGDVAFACGMDMFKGAVVVR
jgi:RND family efflux transporter MFP subunit